MSVPFVRRCLGCCATATILFGGAATVADTPTATAMTSEPSVFFATTNAVRTFFHERPVAEDPTLDAKAQWWAGAMAASHRLVHSNLAIGLQSLPWRILGENVGEVGPRPNAEQAVNNAFVSSMPHFLNLVNPGWTIMGVGVARSADGTVWVAEEFARLR